MQIQAGLSQVRQQFISAKCKSKIYIIPFNSIRSIVFNESSKCVTINYLNDLTKTTIYDDNVKRIFYDTIKDMRSCDNKITEYEVNQIIEN